MIKINQFGVWGLGLNSLASLKKALLGAKKLLKNCNYGSKIYLVITWFAYFSFPFLNLVGFLALLSSVLIEDLVFFVCQN